MTTFPPKSTIKKMLFMPNMIDAMTATITIQYSTEHVFRIDDIRSANQSQHETQHCAHSNTHCRMEQKLKESDG